MVPDGEATDNGIIIKRRTIDYEAVIKSALVQEASFLTLTEKRDLIRDRHIATSIRFTPFPASHAMVRVRYHAEWPIGYLLKPGKFRVSGGAAGVVITLHRPRLIARPSVRIVSYEVLESGILVDEKLALLELQKRLQPEAEKRAAEILALPSVIPRSERALRGFLEPILKQQTDGQPPPPITFVYR